MDAILHKANTRGHVAKAWLESWHTFSFAGYSDPSRLHFGALRVLNDDTVAPGAGFGLHPHQNMEIITIPLQGALEHQDSMGNRMVIQKGDVQVMSAGTGLSHAEKNRGSDGFAKFLQLWIQPNQQNVAPRYALQTISDHDQHNRLLTIVSPMGHPEGIHIYQEAWLSLGRLDKDVTLDYRLHNSENGTYIFVLEGDVTINEFALNRRDGLGLTTVTALRINADTDAALLVIEVPLEEKRTAH